MSKWDTIPDLGTPHVEFRFVDFIDLLSVFLARKRNIM